MKNCYKCECGWCEEHKITFSDVDLKRLKRKIASNIHKDIDAVLVDALLARLEAAEKVLLEIERFNNGILTDTWEFHKWRKAAEK